MGASSLVVGSWPGRAFATNAFVNLYVEALEAAGCRVIDVPSPISCRAPLDVLHIHWPEQLLWHGRGPRLIIRTLRALRALRRLRRAGTHIVWMVHNLQPHEPSQARSVAWRLIASFLPGLVDGIMTLSPSTLPMVKTAFPALASKPACWVRHPRYQSASPSQGEARHSLGLSADGPILAMLGFVRRYKGVDQLIRIFKETAGDDRRLIIAGRCEGDAAVELRALASGDDRILLNLAALSEAELALYTAAADWIVLPFRDYLHSGSMVHALSCGRPVLTPRTAFAEDMSQIASEGAMRLYEEPLSARILSALPGGEPDAGVTIPSLEAIGQDARAFYERLRRLA